MVRVQNTEANQVPAYFAYFMGTSFKSLMFLNLFSDIGVIFRDRSNSPFGSYRRRYDLG